MLFRSVLMADNHAIIPSELVQQVLADEKGIQSEQELGYPMKLSKMMSESPQSMVLHPMNEVVAQSVADAAALKSTRAYWKVSQHDMDEMKFALQKTRGNQRQAALMLNMTLRQFNYRLKKLGMI